VRIEDVPVGVQPVHPATAVLGVHLLGHARFWVGPVRDPPIEDSAVDPVERSLVDQERVVLGMHRTSARKSMETSFAT
jgi:hypothetical protein